MIPDDLACHPHVSVESVRLLPPYEMQVKTDCRGFLTQLRKDILTGDRDSPTSSVLSSSTCTTLCAVSWESRAIMSKVN